MAINPWAFWLNPISDTRKKTLPDSHKLSAKSRLFLYFPNYNFTQSCAVILQSFSSVTWKNLLSIIMTMHWGWLAVENGAL